MILPFLENVNGTTSACAENTLVAWLPKWICGNYLRVRGEYHREPRAVAGVVELPPRARRIQIEGLKLIVGRGTTSACAENTTIPLPTIQPGGNYLRVRGEYAWKP